MPAKSPFRQLIEFSIVLLSLQPNGLTAAGSAQPAPQKPSASAMGMWQFMHRKNAIESVAPALKRAALAAEISYMDSPPAEWRTITATFERKFGGNQNAKAITRVARDQGEIEIAIRGTSTFDDLISDLEIGAEFDEHLQIPIHKGFGRIAGAIYKEINDVIPKAFLQKYDVRLYGHSLGGAVASIVAMHLHEDGVFVSHLITFGTPRFTTNEGARKYQALNQRTFRLVRCDDAVPFLPPPNFIGWSKDSYQASGNFVLLLDSPYFDFSTGVDIERDFADLLRLGVSGEQGRRLLAAAHSMSNYTRTLSKWSQGMQPRPYHYTYTSRPTVCRGEAH